MCILKKSVNLVIGWCCDVSNINTKCDVKTKTGFQRVNPVIEYLIALIRDYIVDY